VHDNSENLADSFVYGITDNDGDVDTAEVTITIRAVNESTPVAVDDRIVVEEGGSVAILATGEPSVLHNDEDLIDTPVEVRVVRRPEHARSFTLNRDGTFRYTHNGREVFEDSFTYEIRDIDGDVDVGEVLISITPASDATPQAFDDEIRIAQGAIATRLRSGASTVLANDRGLDDGPPRVRLVAGPNFATSFTLQPDGTFSYEHDGSRNAVDEFTYEVADNDGQTSLGTVAIDVQVGPLVGDFNEDGVVNERDIDQLVAAITTNRFDAAYDLNQDRRLNADDQTYLLEHVLGTRRGDADLNRKVDFADFLALSASFGRDVARWRHGNFDLDGRVAFGDFLHLSTNFGFDVEAVEVIDEVFATFPTDNA
jgi:hypothetical protein